MPKTLRIILALFCTLIGACSQRAARWIPEPYKLDIPQGNVINQQSINQLRPGMSRQEVRSILGTPVVNDLFHPNRWDYLYVTGQAGKANPPKRVTLTFENDRLTGLTGDFRPGDPAGPSLADEEVTVDVPKRDLSTGVFNDLRRTFSGKPRKPN